MKTRTYKDIDHINYLSEKYGDEMTIDEAMNNLIYLTNPSRGDHVKEGSLKRSILGGRAGYLLRRYDPVAFYASKNERMLDIKPLEVKPARKTVDTYGYRYHLEECARGTSSPYPDGCFMGHKGYVLKRIERTRAVKRVFYGKTYKAECKFCQGKDVTIFFGFVPDKEIFVSHVLCNKCNLPVMESPVHNDFHKSAVADLKSFLSN